MASTLTAADPAKQVLGADGILDNVLATVKVPFTEAEYVEKSVALYAMGITAVLGLCGGIALEARNINIPLISGFLRPKNAIM
jgi:hypothetical protein